MRTFNLIIITLAAVFGLNITACSQKSEITNVFLRQVDTCYKKFVPDSIVLLIADAKTVKMNLDSSMADSSATIIARDCSKEMCAVIKYIIFDDENYLTDTLVKGRFAPWVTITFEGKKKKTVSLEIDLGLWKWKLLDSDNKEICTRDMGNNRKQFLRMVRSVFPDNKKLSDYHKFINNRTL